jgi:hypothetical protein
MLRYVVIMSCLLLSSCAKHKSLQQKSVDQALISNQKRFLDTVIQQEAMLVDIPIPLYDERIIPSLDSLPESHTLVFGYKSPLSRTQVIEFFMTQMERYGWQHLVSFDSVESLLQFSSPDRYCSVIIKDYNDKNLSGSSIFIYIKKSEL